MSKPRKRFLIPGLLLAAVAPLLMAPSGGYPSNPIFNLVTFANGVFSGTLTGGTFAGTHTGTFGLTIPNDTANTAVGAVGATSVTSIGYVNNVVFNPAATALTISGNASNQSEQITGFNSTGHSFGLAVQAGTNSSDTNLNLYSANGASSYFVVYGDGGAVVGSPTGSDKGLGSVNAQAIYVNGVAISAVQSATYQFTPVASGNCTAISTPRGFATCTTTAGATTTTLGFSPTFSTVPTCVVSNSALESGNNVSHVFSVSTSTVVLSMTGSGGIASVGIICSN